jgi:agmatine deiminase
LGDYLGIDKVVWIRSGLVEDYDTDGHVDNVVVFVRPGVVLAQTVDDARDPNHEPLAENVERLRAVTDACGRRLEVIELPVLAPYRGARAAWRRAVHEPVYRQRGGGRAGVWR